MDWLSKHKVLIDYAKNSVKLTTPDGKELEFVTELVVTAKGVANHAKVNQLDASQGSEVRVVNECPDVFLEELPGMMPDRDWSKCRMTTPELAELKEHIKKLLE
jgi:hypothetical protein